MANVCRAFTCTVPEAETMLSSKWRRQTMATLDAMAMMNAVSEFDRVGAANSNLGKGQKPSAPNFSAETGEFVREVVQLGKRRAWLEEHAADDHETDEA